MAIASLTLIPADSQKAAYAFQEPSSIVTSITRIDGVTLPVYPVAGAASRLDTIIKEPVSLQIEAALSAAAMVEGAYDALLALQGQICKAVINWRADQTMPEYIASCTVGTVTRSQTMQQGGGARISFPLQQILVTASVTTVAAPVKGKSRAGGKKEGGRAGNATPASNTASRAPAATQKAAAQTAKLKEGRP